jgi:hypothetical protein
MGSREADGLGLSPNAVDFKENTVRIHGNNDRAVWKYTGKLVSTPQGERPPSCSSSTPPAAVVLIFPGTPIVAM